MHILAAFIITFLILGSFVLLHFGFAARRAIRRNPCPGCARSSLRWSGSRLVRAANGSTLDVVERGHCRLCAATFFQSHQNGFWRATTTDDFPPTLAFATPLTWRDSRRHWRLLNRARVRVHRLSASPRGNGLGLGLGIAAGIASLTVASAVMDEHKAASTVHVEHIPPSVFQPSSSGVAAMTPVDTSAYEEDLTEDLDDIVPAPTPPVSDGRLLASLGVRLRIPQEWNEIANETRFGATLVGFQRIDASGSSALMISTLSTAGISDDMFRSTLHNSITEAQGGPSASRQRIICSTKPRGYFCTSLTPSHSILGWFWTDGGRAYLVVAMVPSGKTATQRSREVHEAVSSMKPII